jgi:hypothetical protein
MNPLVQLCVSQANFAAIPQGPSHGLIFQHFEIMEKIYATQ